MPFRSFQFPYIVVGVVAAILSTASMTARACTLCIGFPKQSVADYVIQSDCVALARPSPNDLFAFAPVEILKGVYRGETIDLFVDSVKRREFAANADSHVALVRDAKDRTWRNLGIVAGDYEAVLRRVVLLSSHWQGVEGRRQRVRFFLPLFGHDHPQVRELAYLEMGRAPYSVIKKLGQIVSREDFSSMLTAREFIEWRPLAILLLAQSNKPRDKHYIIDSFQNSERFKLTKNLSAWAAAAIELQGAEAVEFIERLYFRQTDRKRQELAEVVKALSMHGTEGRTELRDRVVASYAVLLEFHPAMSGEIAKDLTRWKRSELTERLSAIAATGESIDPTARNSIRRYLSLSADSQ